MGTTTIRAFTPDGMVPAFEESYDSGRGDGYSVVYMPEEEMHWNWTAQTIKAFAWIMHQ